MGLFITDGELIKVRLQAFLDELFLERGAASAAGVAAAKIDESESPDMWAKTFRKYQKGVNVPEALVFG